MLASRGATSPSTQGGAALSLAEFDLTDPAISPTLAPPPIRHGSCSATERTRDLNTPTYEAVPVTCPNCNHQFATPVVTLIDADQNPEKKALFVSGRLNIAVCPQCGSTGQLSAPLVYHDVAKELLLAYIPAELKLDNLEQQRVIGDMTNRVMSSLPAEQRRGYLLNPRSFLTLDGMLQAILEADGITPEMLDAQRQRASLLERLVSATTVEARRAIIDQSEEEIDLEFFELLELNVEVAHANGRDDVADQLLGLRNDLLEWTTVGRDIAVREETIRDLGSEFSRESLLEQLVEAAVAQQAVRVETLVAFGRPAIDYLFYQQLTGRIEAAQSEGNDARARTLTDLRQTILALTSEIDAQLQQAADEASNLVERILQSEDLESAVRANADRLDDLFLSALAGKLQAAEQSDRGEDAEKLRALADFTMTILEERQPPELQLINKLLRADYPEATLALLESNRDKIDAQFVELMRMVGGDLTQSGRDELAKRLESIRDQAATLL
jgi:hypothetical protein